MSYDEPFYPGAQYFGDPHPRMDDYGATPSVADYRKNPYYTPTYTNLPENRMHVEQAGFPAITRYMCGTCPQASNPQWPPMRTMSLDERSDRALLHYPPDHDTVRASCKRCVSGFGGGCNVCPCAQPPTGLISGRGMTTGGATGIITPQWRENMDSGDKYEPTSSITISPMHVDMRSFLLVFLFIVLVYICITFGRTILELKQKIAEINQQLG